jgi:copper chaperone CopZ
VREELIRVRGFHCQRCVGSVERGLKALPGVQAVVVHAATQRVIVVYEEAWCVRRQIEWVIYAEGYDLIPTPETFGSAVA